MSYLQEIDTDYNRKLVYTIVGVFGTLLTLHELTNYFGW